MHYMLIISLRALVKIPFYQVIDQYSPKFSTDMLEQEITLLLCFTLGLFRVGFVY
jgi:hypothetical protein